MEKPLPAAPITLTLDVPEPVARALLRIVRELPSDYIDKLASDQEELFALLDAHEAVMLAFIRAGLAEPVQLPSDQDDFNDGAPVPP